MSNDPQYTISELARLAGVTPRTIRYYVSQGLLPAPDGVGPGAHYGRAHLERLRLIRRLQRGHLPLAEIREQLEGLSDIQVGELNRTGEASPPAGSALEYIQGLLGSGSAAPTPSPMAAPPPAATPPQAASPTSPRLALRSLMSRAVPGARPSEVREAEPSEMPRLRDVPAEPPAAVADASATPPATPPSLERSQWERLSLGPNLELHVRRPLSRHEQRRVERLITIARQVLKEEQP